jgi:hypothetical protein
MPVIRLSAKRTSINMISTVTKQEIVRFMNNRNSMNAKLMIMFLNRLTNSTYKKVLLVLENLRVDNFKPVNYRLT